MTTCENFDEAVEDAAAAAAYTRTRDEESLPIESVDRLLSGESPVRVWREHCRMSLAALADQAGIGKGYLSQIENGERTGTINTIKKLARALDIELDDLV
jgi:DNA-binding XRE family transcriptional regulator